MTRGNIAKVLLPLLLGGAILYWMYRDFDWQAVGHVLREEMGWEWMLLSMPFGVSAQLLRGWRWQQLLHPMGQKARLHVLVHAVFLSYASSLVIPRVGEFLRCGILTRYEGTPFPKALGTVVTERAIDTLMVGLVGAGTLLFQMSAFGSFFRKTGMSVETMLHSFSWTGYAVTLVCLAAIGVLGFLLLRRLAVYRHIVDVLRSLWEGISSVRQVENIPLFVLLTLGIWGSYFLHFFLTFYCFGETATLGVGCAMVCFVVGSIAVIVPTPNGAGPWHFAVKTMLILYGVSDPTALHFVLIVHTLQTLLLVLLGIWAWAALGLTRKNTQTLPEDATNTL